MSYAGTAGLGGLKLKLHRNRTSWRIGALFLMFHRDEVPPSSDNEELFPEVEEKLLPEEGEELLLETRCFIDSSSY